MHYCKTEFHINAPAELMQPSRELLADAIADAGFESFEDTPAGLDAYAQKENFDRVALDQAIGGFPFPDVLISYTVQDVEDQDYNKAWEDQGFAPVSIDSVTIYDANHTDSPSPEWPIAIGIAAEQAFGTGTHETTRMIIRQLVHTPLEGKRVLDCGCGTGILSIAAAKLGAEAVVGYDIDEWSVNNTQRNCAINNVENMEVLHGDSSVLSHISGVFDVVLANINRNILLADLAAFKDVLNVGGTIILSGFYEDDARMLVAAAKELGMEESSRYTDNNWCMIALR